MGLIAPNIPSKSDAHQPNPQLVSRIQPIYNPYVSVLDDYRPSGLYMDKIQRSVPQHYVSNHSQSVINELRAGSRLTEAAWLLLTIWMLQQQSVGFQTVRQAPPPPHLKCLYGKNYKPGQFGYGKGIGPRSITVTGATNSGSERNLIQNAYSQIPNISVEGTDWEITAWSVAKHAHHGPDFGLDPTKYGMTQSDLDSIAVNGLINHINQGGTPPNANYVKALQKRWKAFAEHKNVQSCGIQPVMGKDCHVVKHDSTRIFLSFDSESGESFTGYQLTKGQSQNHEKNGIIGKNYKN